MRIVCLKLQTQVGPIFCLNSWAFIISLLRQGLLRWCSGKESACQSRKCVFDSWVGKISWRKKWHPSLVFLSGKFHDRGAWRATVHGVAKRWTQLSMHRCLKASRWSSALTQVKAPSAGTEEDSEAQYRVWIQENMERDAQVKSNCLGTS